MADGRRNLSPPPLDIEQILLEAQHRWLRPAEICEILRNYKKFCIAPESPNRPQSGSIYLFDRKVLRYFRKDGHNWRKKKDGKTVKEAHERLKADSVDVLHCYYAHGEENENFQRRSYWLLEEDFMHIVLVHYLEIKGNRASFTRTRGSEETAQVSHMAIPFSSSTSSDHNQSFSHTVDMGSPSAAHTLEYEDNESDNHQASSRYHPVPTIQRYDDGPLIASQLVNLSTSSSSINSQYGTNFYSASQDDITEVLNKDSCGYTFQAPQVNFDFLTSWDEEIMEHSMTGFHDASVQSSPTRATIMRDFSEQEATSLTEFAMKDSHLSQVNALDLRDKDKWQFNDDEIGDAAMSSVANINDILNEDTSPYPYLLKQMSTDLDGEGLKKFDSFSRWMSKELGEVDDSHLNPKSEPYWSSVESANVLEDPSTSSQEQLGAYLICPSLSQDQLFSIIEFFPSWAYSGIETEVLITGKFLKSQEVENCKWSCMFGEVEVPADIVAYGTLRCQAPSHRAGRFPFYITSSNRLACSEVREFEFREHKSIEESYDYSLNDVDLLRRFEKLLSFESIGPTVVNHDWVNDLSPVSYEELCLLDEKPDLDQELLKHKFHTWLLSKVAKDGRSLCEFDEGGQCVLHLASALGFDWAIEPTLESGVNVNFRDLHGWTALHWAARCGRERTVVFLVSLGAAPGALTDPTPTFPSGRQPADLASAYGHKGIAGFLAEASLTTHLSTLNLKDSGINATDIYDLRTIEDIPEQGTVHNDVGDSQAALSLKDSLSAVRKASLAAAKIHQVFRIESFHRKKVIEIGDDKCGMSEERALSLITIKHAKHAKPGHYDTPSHIAAICIQNKFRSWKGRKEFLITRQRIIKIQAHVRGYQVRKHYKKILWSVGIVEKVILRWRRKGTGLRGFRSEGTGLLEAPLVQNKSRKDDYDFLREGRKQTEARLEKALARVKSMAQNSEARDQYRRLLNIVNELQKSKVMREDLNEAESSDGDFMMELEGLLDEDALMSSSS